MSWIRRRPLATLAALALTLRIVCAVLTEYMPIFPGYYYTDANIIHGYAVQVLSDLAAERPPRFAGTLSEQLQTALTVQTYRVFGPQPLAIKLVNSLLGALGVVTLTWSLSLVFTSRVAWTAGALVSVWPSHVFYTSQNLKEAPADLLAYLALGAALAAVVVPKRASTPIALMALAGSLIGAGFYRSYVLLSLSGGLLGAFALMTRDRLLRTGAVLGAAVVCAALALYPRLSQRVLLSFEPDPSHFSDRDRLLPRLIPVTYDEFDIGTINRPTSPGGITAFRKSRQFADRRWAKQTSGRDIGTQIYPDAEFRTWGEVLAYLPYGALTVLFQPLPLLYPMDGKLGRFAAAGENLILLALAGLAVSGFLHGTKTPARLGLLAFFAAMTIGAALLEFDLGSAGRHKLLYLPMLFPFAAEEVLRLLRVKDPA